MKSTEIYALRQKTIALSREIRPLCEGAADNVSSAASLLQSAYDEAVSEENPSPPKTTEATSEADLGAVDPNPPEDGTGEPEPKTERSDRPLADQDPVSAEAPTEDAAAVADAPLSVPAEDISQPAAPPTSPGEQEKLNREEGDRIAREEASQEVANEDAAEETAAVAAEEEVDDDEDDDEEDDDEPRW